MAVVISFVKNISVNYMRITWALQQEIELENENRRNRKKVDIAVDDVALDLLSAKPIFSTNCANWVWHPDSGVEGTGTRELRTQVPIYAWAQERFQKCTQHRILLESYDDIREKIEVEVQCNPRPRTLRAEKQWKDHRETKSPSWLFIVARAQ